MNYAIFATTRNEKFIIEWLKYYIKVGFNYFYIFDDLSDKPVEEVFNENNIDKNLYSIYRKESNEYLYENLNNNIQNITYSKNFWINYLNQIKSNLFLKHQMAYNVESNHLYF